MQILSSSSSSTLPELIRLIIIRFENDSKLAESARGMSLHRNTRDVGGSSD